MKKALLSLTLIGIIALITVLSCKKTKSNSGATQSFNQLFSGLRTTPQSFSVTAGRDTIVYGTGGTMLHFYTNSFKDAGGNIITTGTVYLQLTEMYKIGDMIANRTATVANGTAIQSAGQVKIFATMNGVEVYANKYGIGFAQSGSSSQKMELFYGNSNNTDSVSTWTVCDTTLNGTTANGTVTDSSGNYFYSGGNYIPPPKPWYYVIDSCSAFDFVNCDYWWGYRGTLQNLTLSIPGNTFNSQNTQAFLAIPSDKINLEMEGGNTLNYTINSGGVPGGLNYVLVVIANVNGQYYYYQQSGVTSDSAMTFTAAMAPDTQSDILARMAGL